MTPKSLHVAVLAAFLLPSVLTGCRGASSKEEPIVPIRNMFQQPRYNPQAASSFFQDGRTMRPPVPGTVSREMESDPAIGEGRTEDGWVAVIPAEVVQRHGDDAQLLARGRGRYDIYCGHCHGASGDGQGMVAKRSAEVGAPMMQPPTFHNDRLRHMPDGQLFGTISNGIRNMPAHGHMIPVDDRWAIVGYVRALQLSQASQTQAMNTEANR